ncbi:O-antigen ligase family protein [uncultured Nostoc sp.]|uniref:O-antigen ligase family protein n=1 Tax=uncultured Nostoc sp. TaxID=340711 RepID=UPI0035CC5D81
MNKLVTILFTLSIILINPFGLDRGSIWTQPKILIIELICILNLFIISQHKLKLSKLWKIAGFLWGLFLLVGAIATINSPEPMRSLLGQSIAKDGLLYWGLIALFTLSNALVLKLKPEIAKQQLKGLIIGGVILGLSIFPQILNWHIDYTVTSGQLFKSHILKSSIYREQQPIGLYSHRGFASFTLAAVGIIALVGWRSSWINKRFAAVTCAVIIPALLFTQTRAGLLAFVVGAGYLLGRKHYKLIFVGAIACILIITTFSQTRNVNNDSIISNLTSNRDYLWKISTTRIKMRPFGWGFDGFEIAYPHLPDGTIKTEPITATKAHNLFIDTALSVGIIGLAVYLGLINFCLWYVLKSSYRDIGAVAIAYLIFTFTWYECAQYTHIFWWSLSFFDYEKVNHSSFTRHQSSVTNHGSMVARVRSWVSRAKTAIFK